MIVNNKRTYIFLAYLFLFFPVTNFLPVKRELYLATFTLATIIYLCKISPKEFPITYFRVLILTSVMIALQTIDWGKGTTYSFIGQIIFITYPYVVMRILGRKYINYFIDIVIFISLVSFIFYFPSLISDSIHQTIGKFGFDLNLDVSHSWKQNFLIYTWEPYWSSTDLLRNAGNFNEPGNFACYLSLALCFNMLYVKNIISVKNLILVVALITTFSTAGYLALFFILTYWVLTVSKSKYRFLILPVVVLSSYYSYTNLSFMENKIKIHYEYQQSGKVWGRFGATLQHLREIQEYPIIGRGLLKQTRFDEVEEWTGDQGPWQNLNGITDTLVRFGVIGFIFLSIWFYRSIKYFCMKNGFPKYSEFLIIGTCMIVLSSQNLVMTPIFWSLFYLQDLYKYDHQKEVIDKKHENLNYNAKLQLR